MENIEKHGKREIKFRAWDKESNQMLPGPNGSPTMEITFWIGQNITFPGLLDNIIFMQYTGLKDKNGKEIWEGDIVQWAIFDPDPAIREATERPKAIVEWLEGSVGFDPFIDAEEQDDANSVLQPRNCEVIGNIYGNPELLHA